MKLRDSLFLLLACAGFAACSSDDTVATDTSADATSTDGVAYLAVKISDVGTGSTRATGGDFLNGTETEYNVDNAYFYFYDKNGNFVTEANVWNDGNAVDGDGNIEFESNTVVALKNLTSTDYPEYVVTVLNKPTDFTAPSTLDAMEAALADAAAEGIQDGDGNFVMSTTSYGEQELAKPFVTQLESSNFSLEPIDLETYTTPVTIYVERLAVKVTVSIDSSLEKTDNGLYTVYATVAGSENGEIQNGVAGTALYLKINGWTLNAKANHSNIVKNIDESWTNDATGLGTGWSWNDASNFRSYWGMSYNYGLTDGGYPTNVTETTEDADGSYTGVSDYLTYVSLSSPTELGEYEYCAENTNTSAIVTANFPSAVTSVLLSATVCDENGDALDLVRYNGILFNKSDYLKYVLNSLNTAGALNAYTKETVDGEDVYTQIDETYVEFENAFDGKVVVTLTDDAVDATLYEAETENGETTYTQISDKTDLINALEGFADDAVAYTGGAMYYNIPIEHLNNTGYDDGEDIPEATYGVVRNHIYKLTITKIANVGKGIYDPDEAIVPNDDDEEFYYVGAEIDILSWKIVNQSVEL